MNLLRHPELVDRLAAAHALGALRGGARRRFEALARQSPALRAQALAWQERLAALTELQAQVPPSPNVWKRIALELQRDAPPAQPAPARRRLAFWRGAALAGGFVALVAFTLAAYTGAQWRAAPEIRYVAMLEDRQSAPALLVTFDAKHGTLTLRRLGDFREPADRVLQLWALPPGAGPRSLGVLQAGGVVRLPAAEGQLRVPALAVSLEPPGGAPAGSGPTGPVLFQGPLVPAT